MSLPNGTFYWCADALAELLTAIDVYKEGTPASSVYVSRGPPVSLPHFCISEQASQGIHVLDLDLPPFEIRPVTLFSIIIFTRCSIPFIMHTPMLLLYLNAMAEFPFTPEAAAVLSWVKEARPFVVVVQALQAADRRGFIARGPGSLHSAPWSRAFCENLFLMLGWAALWLKDAEFDPFLDAAKELRTLGKKYPGRMHCLICLLPYVFVSHGMVFIAESRFFWPVTARP